MHHPTRPGPNAKDAGKSRPQTSICSASDDHGCRSLWGKSPGVVGFWDLGMTGWDVLLGVSLTVLGWAIA